MMYHLRQCVVLGILLIVLAAIIVPCIHTAKPEPHVVDWSGAYEVSAQEFEARQIRSNALRFERLP